MNEKVSTLTYPMLPHYLTMRHIINGKACFMYPVHKIPCSGLRGVALKKLFISISIYGQNFRFKRAKIPRKIKKPKIFGNMHIYTLFPRFKVYEDLR